jgi:exosortase/archaeosortase family protein
MRKNKTKRFQKLRNGFIFLLLFFVFFIFIYIILSYSFLYNYINYFFGIASNFILQQVFGIVTTFSYNLIDGVSVITIPSIAYPIYINSLCTGILEFALLASAILSTFTISWKKRLIGASIAVGIVILFNIIRISTTVYLITSLNLSWANFFHGFLFRLFLIIIVLGFYWLWLRRCEKIYKKRKR